MNKLELETEVVFLHREEIREGIISKINESRSGINYEIEYLNEEEEFCSTHRNSKDVFLTVNELFQSLRINFETKMEPKK